MTTENIGNVLGKIRDKSKETYENIKDPEYRHQVQINVKDKINSGIDQGKHMINGLIGTGEENKDHNANLKKAQEIKRQEDIKEVQALEKNIMQDEDQINLIKKNGDLTNVGLTDIGLKTQK